MGWWVKGNSSVEQKTINVSFSHPPIPLKNSNRQTAWAFESPTDGSPDKSYPRDGEASALAGVTSLTPAEFERDVVGSDDQPAGD